MIDIKIRATIGNPYADAVQNVFLCSLKGNKKDRFRRYGKQQRRLSRIEDVKVRGILGNTSNKVRDVMEAQLEQNSLCFLWSLTITDKIYSTERNSIFNATE